MVQRAEEQYRVHGRIGGRQAAGIANRDRGKRLQGRVVLTLRFFDQASCGIDQVNGIAKAGEPEGVRPRTTSRINDVRRRVRQKAANEFLGALELQLRRARFQPGFLGDLGVIVDDLTSRAVQVRFTSIRPG
jgi:hypothetical protein